MEYSADDRVRTRRYGDSIALRLYMAAVLAASLSILSCGGRTPYIPPEKRTIPDQRSLVFGAISLGTQIPNLLYSGDRSHEQDSGQITTSLGTQIPSGGFWYSGTANVIRESTGLTVVRQPLKNLGGRFYWSLPPGEYAILDIQSSRSHSSLSFGETQRGSRRVYATFTVPSPQMVIYVGTLDLSSQFPVVSNDFQNALIGLHAEFPNVSSEAVTQLLQLEKSR